jgi:hypothetical protein
VIKIKKRNVFTNIWLIIFLLLAFTLNTIAQSNGSYDIIRLTFDDASSLEPMMAIEGSTFHLVWYNNFHTNLSVIGSEIYYMASRDGGKTWSNSSRLTYADGESSDPCIGVNNDTVHIVWCDSRNKDEELCESCPGGDDDNREIYYKVSRDNGYTWSSDTRLTYAEMRSSEPYLAVSGDQIYVVWMDYREGHGSEIYFKMSKDNGYTWDNDTRLTFDSAPSYVPVIAVYNNIIHVVWQDNRVTGCPCEGPSATTGIYYIKSEDNGNNWSAPVLLSDCKYTSMDPHMWIHKEKLFIVWRDDRATGEIYYKFSGNNGNSWSNDTRLTYADNSSTDSYITLYGDTLYVAWEDYRDGYNAEIYYKMGLNDGSTWSNDIRFTTTVNDSSDPQMSANSNGIYLVWDEKVDLNYEIHFCQLQPSSLSITSLNFSNNLVATADSIQIFINGTATDKNKADILCKVQYKPPSGNWSDIEDVRLVSDQWEANFVPGEDAEEGFYDFRVNLISPDGGESGWFEHLDKVQVVYKETSNNNVPGFEISLFALVILVIFLHTKLTYRRK